MRRNSGVAAILLLSFGALYTNGTSERCNLLSEMFRSHLKRLSVGFPMESQIKNSVAHDVCNVRTYVYGTLSEKERLTFKKRACYETV
jgi:hypothetical protein